LTAIVHAVAYLMPGLTMVALAIGLRRAGRAGARSGSAPRWARWYAGGATVVLLLAGTGLLVFGVALARVALTR
jgi:hypothetical protein